MESTLDSGLWEMLIHRMVSSPGFVFPNGQWGACLELIWLFPHRHVDPQ